jgi:hypothetical protein
LTVAYEANEMTTKASPTSTSSATEMAVSRRAVLAGTAGVLVAAALRAGASGMCPL